MSRVVGEQDVATFVAVLDAPPGVTDLGARVEVPTTRAIVSYWRPAALTDGQWRVELDSPLAAGPYLVVWRTPDAEPPDFEQFVPFTVA